MKNYYIAYIWGKDVFAGVAHIGLFTKLDNVRNIAKKLYDLDFSTKAIEHYGTKSYRNITNDLDVHLIISTIDVIE